MYTPTDLPGALVDAIASCEKALDAHPEVRRPDHLTGHLGEVEITVSRSGFTVRVPLRRRDARKNVRWHPVTEFGETLEEAVENFCDSLDRWARVLT